MSKFKLIACINKKNVIGNEGKLLYTIKNDLANFKRMTVGNVIIMGRKTFESLPDGKPLPNRYNIVLTNNKDWCTDQADNLFIAHSVDDVVNLCDAMFEDKELFVIGGESIYREFMEKGLVDEMRLTVVNSEIDGDTHFPEFDRNDWYTYYKSMAQVSSWGRIDTSFYYEILKYMPNEIN